MSNLLLGLVATFICLFVQAVLTVVLIHYYTNRVKNLTNYSFVVSLTVVSGILFLLIIGTMIQIAIWALLFVMLGEFQLFSESFYHSAVNFATLGYGDFVMSEEHKLLGPLEAVNGVIMIGLSTSALIVAFQDIIKRALKIEPDF